MGSLAAAYAEAGQFKEAIITASNAIKLAELHNQQELAEKNRTLLKLYLESKPYRESPGK